MNDKKQIEEMAKVIDDRLIEARGWLGSMNRGEGYWIAQELVKHYQPKLPKDAVVLTEEEAERFRGHTLNIKKVRKETAEKFAFYVESYFAYHNDNDSISKIELLETIKEILKEQFGVEVEL